ncbi:glycosyl transferase [Leminorella grimontii]|uniref:Glycosyl transferase n=1 Tax=Leminorella grimontii TaxID=82981 RepID=A0AAV5MZX4_9GAMM|nr:glycosyltransferase family 2 protein [Leminorella grimontii]KFC97933.1 family 21 glycosyltransferase [Leminorella grimontii ATCC 33999 = DSM 5078]GKX55410.1 glycosyl transferase [Leminorella grimontii]VFS56295.1 hopanoid biosynthesis associated glycosyl transferase protein HpnI [Leminorella grimontii]
MVAIVLLWLAILLFKVHFALRILRAPGTQTHGSFDDVTIMQPILSGDPALESVLASNLRNLCGAKFLWLIDDDDAQAARVTRRLLRCYPQSDVRVCSYPQAPEGINPKLFKLEQGRALVDTRSVLILDDDAALTASSLQTMLGELGDNALVTALPWYRAAENAPSRLLAQFVNDNSALTYLPLLPFAKPLTLNGMCYALRLSSLERVGGFLPIMHHLTDDLALATLLTHEGVEIVQSAATVGVQTSVPDVRRYFRQMHRWFLFATLLMREKSIATNLAIFVLQGLHPLLLWAMIALAFGGAANAGVLAVVLLIRHFALRRVQRAVSADIPARPALSVLSELLQPLHLLNALLNRTIYWRSRRYRIFSNDRFTSL